MQRTTTALVFILTLLLPVLSGAAEHKVRMMTSGPGGPMVYDPSVLKVQVGDTVTFVPAGLEHDSVSIFTPTGAKTWKGKINQTISIKIDKEGIYIYKCTPHLNFAMVGVILAGEPVNLAEAKTFAADLSQRFVMNKTRLHDYLTSFK